MAADLITASKSFWGGCSSSALPYRDCEGKVILSKKNHHQDRSVTENSPNDQVKWYYDKKL